MTHPDDDRPVTPPSEPQYGQPPEAQPPSSPDPYGQAPYPQQYGQPPYGQPQYGQPPAYGQYGEPQGYDPYGHPPARPGIVVAAAVLGFIYGAFGVLATLAAFFLGAIAGDLDSNSPSELDGLADAALGVALVLGLISLAWTVLLIWGSIWALNGRSRVLLLVGGSIALFFTTLSLISSLSSTSGGDAVVNLVLFAGSLAIVVLLSLSPSAQFFAAHRARRGG